MKEEGLDITHPLSALTEDVPPLVSLQITRNPAPLPWPFLLAAAQKRLEEKEAFERRYRRPHRAPLLNTLAR